MSASSKVVAAIVRVVEASRRRSVAVAWVAAAASAAMAFYVARHAGIDTDTSNLISPDKPWRRAAAEMERSFPQNRDLLAVVVDGRSPDQAEDAAGLLAAQLAKRSDLFGGVRDPEGIAFFRRNGLLFLPSDQVQGFADGLIRAQPMLGALAADPSPRGVFDALDLFSQGAIRGDVPASALDRTYDAVAKAVEASLDGRREPLSWQNLMSGRAAEPRELRRILLMQPVLSFGDVQPGRRAVQEVHDAARRLGLTPDNGVTVRVTGPVALNDDQLAALSDGAGLAAGLSLGLLFLWLLLAMRSFRTVTAIVLTLVSGLLACAAFATGFVGPFNPISIAFGPLFIGIAIDFGIQYSVRFAAEHHGGDPSALGDVFERTTKGVGVPLVIAGAATAVGFFSLVPTDYRGVSDLGLIAGVGMVIALVLNLTLLPALLSILRAPGFREAGGFGWAAPIDLFLVRRRAWVFGLCGALAVASAALLAGLRFDFDPVNLENPKAESVKTLFDLMRDPQTTPYTLDILAGSEAEAAALASRISKLPEVGMGLWLGSFVPEDQDAKLDVLLDARGLLEPTLSPARGRQPPSAAESLASAARCASDVGTLASRGDAAAGRLAAALHRAVERGADAVPGLESNLSQSASHRLEDARLALQASRVTLSSLPQELRRDWVTADGRFRIQVFPKGDARRPEVLKAFVASVASLAPGATGMPVEIQESARTVIGAFRTAVVLSAVVITLLLVLILRRVKDVAAVLAPLALAGLLTMATCSLVGMPLNFANIVTIPLLLGIGVAFDIYFVLRWRSGERGILQSPTARGVVFSALTTGTAFGSLIVSNSPGVAEIGKLLSLGLLYTLLATLFFLPAFLGVPPPAPSEEGPR